MRLVPGVPHSREEGLDSLKDAAFGTDGTRSLLPAAPCLPRCATECTEAEASAHSQGTLCSGKEGKKYFMVEENGIQKCLAICPEAFCYALCWKILPRSPDHGVFCPLRSLSDLSPQSCRGLLLKYMGVWAAIFPQWGLV